jgi:hypothetical protein
LDWVRSGLCDAALDAFSLNKRGASINSQSVPRLRYGFIGRFIWVLPYLNLEAQLSFNSLVHVLKLILIGGAIDPHREVRTQYELKKPGAI